MSRLVSPSLGMTRVHPAASDCNEGGVLRIEGRDSVAKKQHRRTIERAHTAVGQRTNDGCVGKRVSAHDDRERNTHSPLALPDTLRLAADEDSQRKKLGWGKIP